MSDREFTGFLASLNSDVRDRALGAKGDFEADFKENVFTEVVSDYLSEVGVIEGAEVCHYEGRIGRGTAKTNGFFAEESAERIEIFTSVFFDAIERKTASKEDIGNACTRAQRFVEACVSDFYKELDPGSDAYAMARSVKEAFQTIDRVRIHVFTDGVSTVKSMEPSEVGGVSIKFEIWDAERLFRVMQSGLPRDEIVINFEERFGEPLACLPMPEAANESLAYLAIILGKIEILQARGKVNKGIRDTIKTEPDRFMAYNNGIVITVDSLEMTTLDSGAPAIKTISGMQIVNGGQTTASIHRAHKNDKLSILSVMVPAKITVVQSNHLDEIVHNISLFANTQNVIQMADFSANDPFHIALEKLSENNWCPGEQGRWFYERARGQYQVAQARFGTTPARRKRFKEQMPPARKIVKTDVAKFLASWDQLPHQVSKGAQKNFVLFMQEGLKGKGRDWVPDDAWYKQMISKAILFKAAQKIVRQEQIPAYRANIVTYLVAYLSYRSGTNLDLDMIWQNQSLSSGLEELMRSWVHKISKSITESAAGRNVTEWAKKDDCWIEIRALDLAIPNELPDELRTGMTPSGRRYNAEEDLSPQDLENTARCKKVDGATWLKIHAWGLASGELKKWQYGIAHTLSSYAAAGWSRSPSPKQAKQAVKILELAQAHGVI